MADDRQHHAGEPPEALGVPQHEEGRTRGVTLDEVFGRRFGPELREVVERISIDVAVRGDNFDLRFRGRGCARGILPLVGALVLLGLEILRRVQP